MLLFAPVAFHVLSLVTETLHIFPVKFALKAVPELRLLLNHLNHSRASNIFSKTTIRKDLVLHAILIGADSATSQLARAK